MFKKDFHVHRSNFKMWFNEKIVKWFEVSMKFPNKLCVETTLIKATFPVGEIILLKLQFSIIEWIGLITL